MTHAGAALVNPLPASSHRGSPLVHGSYTHDWWRGDARFEAVFGPPPTLASLAHVSTTLGGGSARGRSGHEVVGLQDIPRDALIVLAGQQPGLGGGPLLVAHKAATAVALASTLTNHLRRPVVAVFLLADEDHDTTEVDHVDVISESTGELVRLRCPISPRGEALYRCSWDPAALVRSMSRMMALSGLSHDHVKCVSGESCEAGPVRRHATSLILTAFGHLGLRVVSAHSLSLSATDILARGLEQAAELSEDLAAAGARLAAAGLPASFDAADPRPLVMESRDGRRRRVAAGDREVLARLASEPDDFSPHAALRPMVQAATLPVVAQICGPSELLYLAQARGLHARFGLQAPILVPRLEATRLGAAEIDRLGGDLSGIDIGGPGGSGDAGAAPFTEEQALLAAARTFTRRVLDLDPGLARSASRWLAGLERGARRLAEAPAWRGRLRPENLQRLRPRGRWQDTVLAWLPDALRGAGPRAWAEHVVSLCRPLEPPAHVLHVLPGDSADG